MQTKKTRITNIILSKFILVLTKVIKQKQKAKKKLAKIKKVRKIDYNLLENNDIDNDKLQDI